MDKIDQYRQLLKQILSDYYQLLNRRPIAGQDTELIFDEERDHYMIHNVGWTAQGPVCGPTVYIRLRDSRFRIEQDWTGHGIATDLVRHGVPTDDIILAFQPPGQQTYVE